MSQGPYSLEDPNEKFVDIGLLKKILTFALSYKVQGLIAFLILVVSQIIPFFFPHILNSIIDGPIKEKEFEGVMPWLFLYFGLVFVGALLTYVYTMFASFQKIRYAAISRQYATLG